MKIVLNTNVLVSGLLSPHGPPGQIVQWVADGTLRLCFDVRIIAEYREVLSRPEFDFDPEHIGDLLTQIEGEGESVVSRPWPTPLPDRDDEKFLEAARAGSAECVITGNLRHYPAAARHRQKVVAPAQFIEIIRRSQT
jgi:uncharacterized protein